MEDSKDFPLGLTVSEVSVEHVSGHTQKRCPGSGFGGSHLLSQHLGYLRQPK